MNPSAGQHYKDNVHLIHLDGTNVIGDVYFGQVRCGWTSDGYENDRNDKSRYTTHKNGSEYLWSQIPRQGLHTKVDCGSYVAIPV